MKNPGLLIRIMAGTVFLLLILALLPCQALAEDEPKIWEQLFFPFPIVGAPPQLEQQVQLFGSYFTGNNGHAFQPSAELAFIATAHLGLVATLPYQSGGNGQPTGLGDFNFLIQDLIAGSLEQDNMLSIGIQTFLPTGAPGISQGDLFTGPFAYGAQRFFKHLIFEGNVTALFPVEHSATAKQLGLNGLVSYLLTAPGAGFPVYAQLEADSTLYYSGAQALPPDAGSAPAWSAFLAPEVFLGPFESPISDGTRVAAGVFFNVTGDSVHERTYTVTAAFDIPNRFGY